MLALFHFLIQPDVSISSSLIGLRDKASCKFPTQYIIFQLARKSQVSRIYAIASPKCVYSLLSTFHFFLWLLCNLLAQIITFALGVHIPLEWFTITGMHFTTFILNCNNISQYYCFYCIFAALVSKRDFSLSLKKKVLWCMYNKFNSNFSADKWLTNISLVDVSVYYWVEIKTWSTNLFYRV